MLPGKRWIAGFSRKTRSSRVGVERGDLGGVEPAEPLLQLERAGKAVCTVTCWSSANPISSASGLARDQGVGLLVPGEVEHVGHGSILPLPGTSTSCPNRSRRPRSSCQEAERGRSERTPWLVWGGMHLVVGALVVVVLAIAFVAYLLA